MEGMKKAACHCNFQVKGWVCLSPQPRIACRVKMANASDFWLNLFCRRCIKDASAEVVVSFVFDVGIQHTLSLLDANVSGNRPSYNARALRLIAYHGSASQDREGFCDNRSFN
jgi:hypothetical protein